jgi:hypothetical protein
LIRIDKIDGRSLNQEKSRIKGKNKAKVKETNGSSSPFK